MAGSSLCIIAREMEREEGVSVSWVQTLSVSIRNIMSEEDHDTLVRGDQSHRRFPPYSWCGCGGISNTVTLICIYFKRTLFERIRSAGFTVQFTFVVCLQLNASVITCESTGIQNCSGNGVFKDLLLQSSLKKHWSNKMSCFFSKIVQMESSITSWPWP